MEFKPMAKMARLSREIIVSEKIDGTNAQITIVPSRGLSYHEECLCVVPGDRSTPNAHTIFAGSRTRWIQPGNDNYGFAAWVKENHEELLKLGPGTHFGEWWGAGIQRRYGISEKRFSLFNVSRWASPEMIETLPACCSVVPVLYRGEFCTAGIQNSLYALESNGSYAAPGFPDPEGIVVFHVAAGIAFKKTLDGDEAKGAAK